MSNNATIDTTYNGYKNRQTWNVVLWLMNDEGLYRAAEQFAKGDVSIRSTRAFCSDVFGYATPDGCRISGQVDWKAVAAAIRELRG